MRYHEIKLRVPPIMCISVISKIHYVLELYGPKPYFHSQSECKKARKFFIRWNFYMQYMSNAFRKQLNENFFYICGEWWAYTQNQKMRKMPFILKRKKKLTKYKKHVCQCSAVGHLFWHPMQRTLITSDMVPKGGHSTE